MNTLTIALALALQLLSKQTVLVYQQAGTDPNELHKSANIFATRIGQELKNRYPVRVADAGVKLSFEKREGHEVMVLKWHCLLVSSTSADADRHFDRRGSLLSGHSMPQATSAVEGEIKSSGKLKEMEGYREIVISRDWSQDNRGLIWAIEEHFFAHR